MRIQNQYLREFIAEVFGTFLLLIFINGSVAQNLFFTLDNVAFSSNLTINICIGFGVSMAVLTVGKVSGAHLNPAVSLSNFLIGNLSIKRFITYMSAQFIGGFLGAGAIFVLYHDQISNYERSLLQKNETVEFFSLKTASIFATYPNEHLTILSALFDQIFGTAILIIFVLALSDKKNEKMSHASVAAYVGVTVMIIGMAFGYNCGYAINPARDLSPRLLTFLAGWGPQVFEFRNYFWIPIAGPAIGSIVGTVLYYTLIGNNWPYNEIETHNKWEITDV